jgi:hypothetical protein
LIRPSSSKQKWIRRKGSLNLTKKLRDFKCIDWLHIAPI